MKTKINVQELCEQYNRARTQNAGKKGNSEWVIGILKSFGISGSMSKRLLHESILFTPYKRDGEGRGNYRGYIFPQTPVHITWFQNWINPQKNNPKKDQSFEEQCTEYLRKQGYKLRKCIGFDEDAFKKEYPKLWEKFLIYEEV